MVPANSGSAAVAHDEFGGEGLPQDHSRLFINEVKEKIRSFLAQVGHGLTHGAQRWMCCQRFGGVVEADHPHVMANTQAASRMAV